MIPKKIHYCWFGNGEIPKKDKKCIESWKKFCPDYEIIQWNETNYDVTKNPYMYEAYKAKKWAFVSDYARLDIIYEYGGFYMDTDVELIKPLDNLRKHKGYLGFEKGDGIIVNLGLGFGAEKNNKLIKELKNLYTKKHFVNIDGSLNLTPITIYTTKFLQTKGLIKKNIKQCIEGVVVYPIEYFAPKDIMTEKIKITKNTISIHHYHSSWLPKYQLFIVKIMKKIFGEKNYRKIIKIIKKLFNYRY